MRKTKKLLLVALALVIVALAALAACEPKPETFSLTFDFGYDNLKEVVEIKGGEKAQQIGRASVGKECRSRWSPYH